MGCHFVFIFKDKKTNYLPSSFKLPTDSITEQWRGTHQPSHPVFVFSLKAIKPNMSCYLHFLTETNHVAVDILLVAFFQSHQENVGNGMQQLLILSQSTLHNPGQSLSSAVYVYDNYLLINSNLTFTLLACSGRWTSYYY